MKPTIQILLPTFNGVTYLDEQLTSLCVQSYRDFSILTYDDGSQDNSRALVDSYGEQLSIVRIDNPATSNAGALKSFELLLQNATADIIFFCDQDDIWEPAKIEEMVATITTHSPRGATAPTAVFSDLSLFSERDPNVTGSFMSTAGFNPAALNDPYYLSFRNPAPGCSMVINKALRDRALPFPAAVKMHDWYLMLCARLQGNVVFINKSLLRYRIHSANTLGIAPDKPLSPLFSILSLVQPAKVASIISTISANTAQGKAAFTVSNRRFSRILFWSKFIAGRYIFPTLARTFGLFTKNSWKR